MMQHITTCILLYESKLRKISNLKCYVIPYNFRNPMISDDGYHNNAKTITNNTILPFP